MAFKGWRLTGLLTGSCVVVFAASAFAGYANTPGVSINDTNRTAEGSMVGARSSGNSTEQIGFTEDNFSIYFYAVNAAGSVRSCSAPSPSASFRSQVAAITSQSWLQFGWGQYTGYCEGNNVIVNNSQYTSP